MTRRGLIASLPLALVLTPLADADEKTIEWATVERQTDLEKRASLAMDYARHQVSAVVEAFQQSDADAAKLAIAELVKGVETAQQALDDTGKKARRKPKHFKRAEIATRRLVGAIEDAQRTLLSAEREQLEPAKERVEEINSQLMMAIFRK